MSGEHVSFEMHPSLIRDIIKRQTGSLDRALQEAIQNSEDAGASEIRIITSATTISISDNGCGFSSKDDVMRCFRRFGEPHTVAENKKFGQFRMGRGQCFAHGITTYESRNYRMVVDIEEKKFKLEAAENGGLSFLFQESENYVEGCVVSIELYNTLSTQERVELINKLTRSFAFVSTPVYLDGHKINRSYLEKEWQQKGDCHVADLRPTGNLNIYNLGVLVRTAPYNEHMVGGDIVSTAAMQLNFARNEPIANCPIWQDMKEGLSTTSIKFREELERSRKKRASRSRPSYVPKTPRLTMAEVKRRLLTVINEGYFEDKETDPSQPMLRFFDKAAREKRSRPQSIKTLIRKAKKTQYRVCLRAAYAYGSDVATEHNLFTVVDRGTFHHGKHDNYDEAFAAFIKAVNEHLNCKLQIINEEEAAKLVSGMVINLKQKELDGTDNAIIDAVDHGLRELSSMFWHYNLVLCIFGDKHNFATILKEDNTILINRDRVRTLWTYDGWVNFYHDIFVKGKDIHKEKDEAFIASVPKVVYSTMEHLCNDVKHQDMDIKKLTADTLDTLKLINNAPVTKNAALKKLKQVESEVQKAIQRLTMTGPCLTIVEAVTDKDGSISVDMTEELKREFELFEAKNKVPVAAAS